MSKETGDKRSAILKSGLEAFAEFGFHGAPTSLIAKQANVGVGTIYRYFENKDDLIEAIHEQEHNVFVQVFGDNYDPQRPVRENFLSIFTGLTKLFIASPFAIKFMEQYYNSPYGIAKKRAEEIECDRPLADFFAQGKAQQVIKDLPFEILLSFCFGPVLMLTRDHLNGFVNLDDATIAAVLEACWDAIKR